MQPESMSPPEAYFSTARNMGELGDLANTYGEILGWHADGAMKALAEAFYKLERGVVPKGHAERARSGWGR